MISFLISFFIRHQQLFLLSFEKFNNKSGLFVASDDEDRKDFWIWIFSILVIFLAFIFWYLSTNYYNDNNFFFLINLHHYFPANIDIYQSLKSLLLGLII